MTDEDSLLDAIAESPRDDTPRLVYADWLDEHDRPVQAEFIRLQCTLAGLDDRSMRVRRQNIELWRRQQEILEHHRRELLGPLDTFIHERDAVFERGFLAELSLEVDAFRQHAKEVAKLRPLPDVRVTGAAGELIEIVDDPHTSIIARLEVFDIWDRPAFFSEPEHMPRLAQIVRFPRLQALNLNQCQIGYEGLEWLTNRDQPPGPLTDLDLSSNNIDDAGVRVLVESPLFPQLKRLVLIANPITDEGARLLAAAPGELKSLDVRHTAIGAAGQQVLLRRKSTKIDLF